MNLSNRERERERERERQRERDRDKQGEREREREREREGESETKRNGPSHGPKVSKPDFSHGQHVLKPNEFFTWSKCFKTKRLLHMVKCLKKHTDSSHGQNV